MEAQDFKLDENEDLYIDPVAQDFVIAPSDHQHVKDVLQSVPGWWKEFPLVGWNPYKRLNARTNKLEMNKEAKVQLQSDGYTVNALDLDLSAAGEITLNKLDVTRD